MASYSPDPADAIASTYELGCRLPPEQWLWLNRTGIFERPELRRFVAPFPPQELMDIVSTVGCSEQNFASHGTDLFRALQQASPKPLSEFDSMLDFGCGCGRLARMFKGHSAKLFGCDVDRRHVEFIKSQLDFMEARVSGIHPPLPFADDQFDAVISISVFSHLSEASQDEFLRDLRRVSRPGAYLFLSIHGDRALSRAQQEEFIWKMISVAPEPFETAKKCFAAGKHAFILQQGHLTTSNGPRLWWHRMRRLLGGEAALITEPYAYGITFLPERYIREHWGRWFEIRDYRPGAIHNFQDIVVLRPRKGGNEGP